METPANGAPLGRFGSAARLKFAAPAGERKQ
jgi:hypothetical protein